MKTKTSFLLGGLMLLSFSDPGLARDVTVMISGGFRAALEKLGPDYEQQSGNHLVVIPGPSMGKTPQAIPNRLARGEHADVVIMVGDALSHLQKQHRTVPGTRVELADSPIGMVVKAGSPVPTIGTESALRATLLQAKSIAYSDSASGRYVSRTLFKTLGIYSQMQTKAHMIERIPVATGVASGRDEIGLQQVSELLPVQGVTFVGELPDSVQYITRFAGAVVAGAAHPYEAEDLLAFLASAAAQKTIRGTGMRSVQRTPVMP